MSAWSLDDLYPAYLAELDAFRAAVRAVARAIVHAHLREALAAQGVERFRATASLFGARLVDYLLDLGDLTADGAACRATTPLDDDPDARAALDRYAAGGPRREALAWFLAACRDVAGGVLAGGDGLRLLRARDPRGLLARWESVMLDAPILAPCRALAARALAAELDAPRVVFEGGAGVGVVLRTLLSDAALAPSLVNVRSYHFTELDPAILAMGRAALARRAPEPFARALRYRRLDLDVVARDPGAAGLARGEADVVVLEHVLYDVEDLGATLDALRWILRPGGALIFTGAFRGRPASFFPCEMLQLTLASYRRARLDPPYRTEVGYLPLDAWARSLARAGFTFEVWPPPSQHERMPHGGVVARAP